MNKTVQTIYGTVGGILALLNIIILVIMAITFIIGQPIPDILFRVSLSFILSLILLIIVDKTFDIT